MPHVKIAAFTAAALLGSTMMVGTSVAMPTRLAASQHTAAFAQHCSGFNIIGVLTLSDPQTEG